MSSDRPTGYSDADHQLDVKVLHGMGYAQELERRRFKGPPIGEEIARRQALIREAERAVSEIR
jgi:hypothetical protein